MYCIEILCLNNQFTNLANNPKCVQQVFRLFPDRKRNPTGRTEDTTGTGISGAHSSTLNMRGNPILTRGMLTQPRVKHFPKF